ncbi:alanine racemase [Burkholderia sp. SG-MS1]|uniref:alanine racemase n=1 Tax=Paraburkholderia sp. SG-MS1 TaxID=2023741 RepID=UPI00144585F9|nr:alanine racemase [Paraburkholderia sp. SG-MS1]NKJ49328.1 alanine racemase [Paraburkholderia sp. SG-MS1]
MTSINRSGTPLPTSGVPGQQSNEVGGPSTAPAPADAQPRGRGKPSALLGGLGQAPGQGSPDADASIRKNRTEVRGLSPVNATGKMAKAAPLFADQMSGLSKIEVAVRTAIKDVKDADARATVTVTVDLGKFRENFRAIRDIVGKDTELSTVVKADAYGMGAVKVAQALEKEGCDKFFVATLQEAIDMRNVNGGVKPETTVFVLGGPQRDTAHQYVEHNITPVLNTLAQVKEWNELGAQLGKKLPAILQFDTGMSRQGIAPRDRSKVAFGSDALANIDVKYLMSHLATASEATLDEATGERRPSESMELQREAFEAIRTEYPGVRASLAASSALHVKNYQYDMVRVGGAIHGQHLFDDQKGRYTQPATVESRINEVRDLDEGDRIGYGLVYDAREGDEGGTIPGGYTDGVARGLGSSRDDDGRNVVNGHIVVDGRKVPVTGNVSMDTATVDLTGVLAEKRQALLDKLNAPRAPGIDPDTSLIGDLERLKTTEGILDAFANSKVVLSDDNHPFDKLAEEAKEGGDKRINVSKVSIDFGTSPRVRKVYVDRTDQQNAADNA